MAMSIRRLGKKINREMVRHNFCLPATSMVFHLTGCYTQP